MIVYGSTKLLIPAETAINIHRNLQRKYQIPISILAVFAQMYFIRVFDIFSRHDFFQFDYHNTQKLAGIT